MTDDLLDPRLVRTLRAYADGGTRPIDAMAIASASAAGSRAHGIGPRWTLGFGRRTSMLVLAGLLVLALAASAVMVGSGLLSLKPTPRIDRSEGGGFAVTGPPIEERRSHTATKLLDGRVLIVGGQAIDDGRILASAEIYDPKTGAFSPTGSLTEPRWDHSALRLRDGRVLITGGYATFDSATGDVPSTSVEIYDPSTGQFSAHDPFDLGGLDPASVRGRTRAIQLADDRIIVIGPWVKIADDESGNTMVHELDASGATAVRRADLSGCVFMDAQPLDDIRILVLCGEKRGLSPRIYDSSTGRWSTLQSVATFASWVGPDRAIVLGDGRVLLVDVGGQTGLILFDPATGKSMETGSPSPVDSPAIVESRATRLPDGRVFFAGALQDNVWDPMTGVTTKLRSAGPARFGHTVTLLDDGRVLIVGPREWPADHTLPHPPGAELFDPAALP